MYMKFLLINFNIFILFIKMFVLFVFRKTIDGVMGWGGGGGGGGGGTDYRKWLGQLQEVVGHSVGGGCPVLLSSGR